MATKKKSVPSKNKPGPWDDIARGAGAVKRTVYSNPGNKNKASNIDKWLKGGNYQQREISQLPGDVVTGVKALGRGINALTNKIAPPAKQKPKTAPTQKSNKSMPKAKKK